jgi:N-acetylglucosamine-6-sulfatase
VFLEYYTDRVFPRTLTMGYEAVRTDRLKYIVYTELPGMDELYDLSADPFEMQNLIGTERGHTLVAEARTELERLKSGALPPR